MKEPNLTLIISAVALIAALIGAIVALMFSNHEARPLSCAALPVRFVMENPECAQRLLEAVNVSGVRVENPDRFFAGSASCTLRNSCNGTSTQGQVAPIRPDDLRPRS
ncbi:MAG: hypothetical protein NTX87_20370 [Planctomycetota bacterium]|nr:hypothetical protein [Planctomycetota bacterium]